MALRRTLETQAKKYPSGSLYALIAAEQRIGELLLEIPKASGQFAESKNRPMSKNTIVKEMGYSKDEASDYQQMAKHPEVVQKVIEEALAIPKASGMRTDLETSVERSTEVKTKT